MSAQPRIKAPGLDPSTAGPGPAPAATLRFWVSFRLDGQGYAVDVRYVREVLRMERLEPVPGAPATVAGLVNDRGRPLTILDLRQRLGLPAREAGPHDRIVVLETASRPFGIVVDEVTGVIELTEAEIEPLPRPGKGRRGACLKGFHAGVDEALLLLDAPRLSEPAPPGRVGR